MAFSTYRLFLCGVALLPGIAYAQVAGPADVGRVGETPSFLTPAPAAEVAVPTPAIEMRIPPQADQVALTITRVDIEGMTAFSRADIDPLLSPYMHRETSLESLWLMAAAITAQYQQAGYFLSRAFVPNQQIDGGMVQLVVVEGYIGHVALDNEIGEHSLVQRVARRIQKQKPVSTKYLEQQLLLLNDLPGRNFRTVIEPWPGGKPGAAMLRIIAENAAPEHRIYLNNFGSRYFGPHQMGYEFRGSLLANQRTEITALTSVPTRELQYFDIDHAFNFTPSLAAYVTGSVANAAPGYDLTDNEIEGRSYAVGVGLRYQAIRQRQENLQLFGGLDGKNVSVDSFGIPITRDHIRAVRGGLRYDNVEEDGAAHAFSLTVSQGLGFLGASESGELLLSRAEADPEFTKLEFSALRQQVVSEEFLLTGQVMGQLASDPLYSAEEFGFGGPYAGRGYDASEITGDHGLGGSVELGYLGIAPMGEVTVRPYVFYDIGKVWNDDGNGSDDSLSSVGIGSYIRHSNGLGGKIAIAQPLTRNVAAPIYGQNGDNPRLIFEISYNF